ncbi:MAG: SDR family NAD(P)-dependent oxidoreductase, partial [Thaumarchaeota archaeon]|nr:SDR family NAD(P)-dependent oxidoreductase [Nitrososphaerota archaeon]
MGSDAPPLSELISLKGRRALVTGAASGIGEATAYRLAEAGADLELGDINMDGLRKVLDRASSFGVDVNLHRVDLSDEEAVARLWRDLE